MSDIPPGYHQVSVEEFCILRDMQRDLVVGAPVDIRAHQDPVTNRMVLYVSDLVADSDMLDAITCSIEVPSSGGTMYDPQFVKDLAKKAVEDNFPITDFTITPTSDGSIRFTVDYRIPLDREKIIHIIDEAQN